MALEPCRSVCVCGGGGGVRVHLLTLCCWSSLAEVLHSMVRELFRVPFYVAVRTSAETTAVEQDGNPWQREPLTGGLEDLVMADRENSDAWIKSHLNGNLNEGGDLSEKRMGVCSRQGRSNTDSGVKNHSKPAAVLNLWATTPFGGRGWGGGVE